MFGSKKNMHLMDKKDLRGMAELIEARESFQINGVDHEDTFEYCAQLEEMVEERNLTCRIYTQGRLLAGLAGLFNFRLGMATLAGYAIHNILTRNPDYEISRDLANKRIYVTYQH